MIKKLILYINGYWSSETTTNVFQKPQDNILYNLLYPRARREKWWDVCQTATNNQIMLFLARCPLGKRCLSLTFLNHAEASNLCKWNKCFNHVTNAIRIQNEHVQYLYVITIFPPYHRELIFISHETDSSILKCSIL